jgi:hypothetical protein
MSSVEAEQNPEIAHRGLESSAQLAETFSPEARVNAAVQATGE